MDRDHRWNRTEQAVNCMLGQGPSILDSDHKSFISYIQQSYKNGQGDEFLLPVQNPDFSGIQEGDSLICFNFRPDRVRQILSVLCGQESKAVPNLSAALGFALYDPKLPMSVLFPKQMLGKGLGQALSEAGLRQLRLAETEKYPHVTYFFNGGREEPFAGEDRILIPSPKDVSTYDLKPEMSAFSVRDAALTALDQGIYDVLIINFANPDMVGHCGILSAAIAAVETVDHCLQDILDKILSLNGTALILADHGNCEVMWDAIHNCPHTSHTLNPVRAYLVGEDSLKLKSHGDLCDIAPSLLQLLHISAPAEMTGTSLIDLNPVI